MKQSFSELLKKYDVQVPRYTSYPTVPAWSKTPEVADWLKDLRFSLTQESDCWSAYIHIPYCETLCTFCGCNNIITKDHSKSSPYVDLVLQEFAMYLQQVPELLQRPLRHLHLGGGSPTFLSSSELGRLVSSILKQVKVDKNLFEGSVEVDPRRTTLDQLQVLKELGFNRVSMGVQDFNEQVQVLINRKQSFEITEALTVGARKMGYSSVNFDLIYGLPAQTEELIKVTVEKTISLRPDRIAFYSFALVPWIKPAQRLFTDEDLPSGESKRRLYEIAREEFLKAGYIEVGMDHFALPEDELAVATRNQTLHRNFMGYTDKKTDVLLGLGVSSISESKNIFHQNEKLLPKYEQALKNSNLPTTRGHILSSRDSQQRKLILQLITQFQVTIPQDGSASLSKEIFEMKLADFIKEGLVRFENHTLFITEAGRPFLRNICALFDDYIPENSGTTTDKKLFSKSI